MMTAIEETMMMHANSSSSIMTSSGSSDSISRTDALLNDLPRRSVGERGKSYSPKGQIDIRLALLMVRKLIFFRLLQIKKFFSVETC